MATGKDKSKLFGKQTVAGMKEVQNAAKFIDKMAASYDDLNETQQKSVDLAKQYTDGLKESLQYSNSNKDKAKEIAQSAQTAVKGGKLSNTLRAKYLQITDKILGTNNDIAIGISQQAADLKENGALVQGISDKFAEMKNNILAALGPMALLTAAIGFVTKIFTTFSGLIDKTGEQFGAVGVASEGLTTNVTNAQMRVQKLGMDFDAIVPAVDQFTKSMGMGNAEAIELAVSSAEISKTFGTTVDTSAQLISNFEMMAGASREAAIQMTQAVGVLAGSEGVNPNVVMEDMAGSSELIAKYGKDSGANIAKAAVHARKFGNELATAEKIADGLLDFESSIQKEMEASMLIGKQLNFNSARQKALQGDISGAMGDVLDQVGGQAEFEKMNVLQRQALADSIGVSVGEMAKFMNKQDEVSDMADATSESMQDMEPGVTPEQALSAMSQALGELQSQLTNIVGEFGPQLEALAQGVANFVKDAIAGLGKVVKWFQENEWAVSALKKVVIGLTAAWATYKVGLLAVNAASTAYNVAVGTYNTIVKIATGLQYAWNVAMTANPIGLIIAAVAALVAGVVLLYNNWDTVKEAVAGFVTYAWETLTGFWDYISGLFNWDAIFGGIGVIFNGLVDIVKMPFNWIIKAVNLVIRGLNKLSFTNPFTGNKIGFDIAEFEELKVGTEIQGVKSDTVAKLHAGETVLNKQDSSTLASGVGGIDYDKLAMAMSRAMNGLNLKTTATQEQLNIALTSVEG